MAVTEFKMGKRDLSEPWDMSQIVTNIKWTTDIDFAAGELAFTILEVNEGFFPSNGDSVCFKWDNNRTFFGYVFSISYKSDETIEVVAYDRLRYFKNQDTIVWPVGNALQRFNSIMERTSTPHDNLAAATTNLPAEVSDGKTYFDMLKSAFDATHSQSGNRYAMRDVYGLVQFIRVASNNGAYISDRTPIIIGDGSLLIDFTFGSSIDELYNVVKLIRETEDEQKRTVYTTKTANSDSSQRRYGTLQIVEKADDKLNDSQMQDRANQLLRQHNKEKVTLTINAIGHEAIRAGTRFYISIQDLRDIGIGTREVLATKVTHNFKHDWTMTIDAEMD